VAFTEDLNRREAPVRSLTRENGSQARTHIGAWLGHYNHTRPHSTFDGQTPDEVYNLSYRQRPTPEEKKHAA